MWSAQFPTVAARVGAWRSPPAHQRGRGMSTRLVPYDICCRALAEAVAVDDVKDIHDQAAAMAEYARRAKNHKAEADAVAIRMRAARRLGQLMQAQKESVGLATGGEHGGRRRIDGSRADPSILRPTLAMQGIDKHLAHQARTLGALSDSDFETVVSDARDKGGRAVRNAVREIEIEQERESYAARTKQGGTVEDLEALIKAGKTFGVICPDFPWEFKVYSAKGKQRSAERYYDTWSLERIKAFAHDFIPRLAAKDCALLLWSVWPRASRRPRSHRGVRLRLQDRRIPLGENESGNRGRHPDRQGAFHRDGLRDALEQRGVFIDHARLAVTLIGRCASNRHRASRRAQRETRRGLSPYRTPLSRSVPRIVRAQGARGME